MGKSRKAAPVQLVRPSAVDGAEFFAHRQSLAAAARPVERTRVKVHRKLRNEDRLLTRRGRFDD